MSDDVEGMLKQILTAIDALARRVEALERQPARSEVGNTIEHLTRAIAGARFRPPERRIDPELSAKRSAAAKSMWDKVKSHLSTEKSTEQSTPTRRRLASKLQANRSSTESEASVQVASNLLASASKSASKPEGDGSPGEPLPSAPSAAAAKVWLAYATAYKLRYGVFPVRNAKTNGIIKHFVGRVPMAEAPDVAEFYVGDAEPVYAKSSHALELMLRDAEKLRTAWATGQRVNGTDSLRRPWWEVWSSVETMGKELGIEQGDNPTIFKNKVLRAAAGAGKLPEEIARKLGIERELP